MTLILLEFVNGTTTLSNSFTSLCDFMGLNGHLTTIVFKLDLLVFLKLPVNLSLESPLLVQCPFQVHIYYGYKIQGWVQLISRTGWNRISDDKKILLNISVISIILEQ